MIDKIIHDIDESREQENDGGKYMSDIDITKILAHHYQLFSIFK